MKVQAIRIEDYQYDLPNERIAKYPLAQRDASKLLIYQQSSIQEDLYAHIDQYLPEGALMLFNNTKVIPARIYMRKPTGGQVEVFCLEPLGEIATALSQGGESHWKCLIGGAKKWKEGLVSTQWTGPDQQVYQLDAELINKLEDHFHLRFRWTPQELSFAEVLSAIGQIPLPPYLNREADATDTERYQTIYAHHDGSVAAPTAGLHFTEGIFQRLAAKNIQLDYVTLHVGAGTFKPVSAPTIGDHDMHAEYFEVSIELIKQLEEAFAQGRPVIGVGTTTLRTLESLYLMGAKLHHHPELSLEALEVKQWDAYQPVLNQVSAHDAFSALSQYLNHHQQTKVVAKTQLLIAPGYRVKTIQGLCTNFHQPGSTLLLLIAALVGEGWKTMYQYALDHDFRFLSYGDGCYIECTTS